MQPKENLAQQQAIRAENGHILVVAGPGTGKTKTLTDRIAFLLHQKHVSAADILALTFTKKAAEEMKTRVAALVSGEQPTITTFHGLCYEILGESVPFATEPQRLKIITSLAKPTELTHLSSKEFSLAISNAKNTIEVGGALEKVVESYNQALHAQGLRDFDDLLVDTYAALQSSKTRKQFLWILVDEFQDTNRLQYEILKLLAANAELFVIGDPNQSIYGFRGASGDIFEQFKADFSAVKEITLTTNYRSAPEIVRLSNAIFPDQPALKPNITQKGQVRVVEVLNEYGEADWVLGEIQKAIGGGDFLRAVSDDERAQHRTLRDFAVLYRSRSAALALQKAVEASGLPYQIVGEGSPYEKPQVQAVIAVLRSIHSGEAQELESLSPAHQRQATELLQQHANLAPAILAEKIIATLGLEPSRGLSQLVATLVRFDTTKAALDYIDDIAQHGFYDPRADAITLLTIHAAKGLEFPVVFLIGTQQGILPSDRGEIAEEKRLFYVAATRAKERLEITYARNRGGKPAQTSSFITELPTHVLEHITDPNLQTQARRIAKRQTKRSQGSLF